MLLSGSDDALVLKGRPSQPGHYHLTSVSKLSLSDFIGISLDRATERSTSAANHGRRRQPESARAFWQRGLGTLVVQRAVESRDGVPAPVHASFSSISAQAWAVPSILCLSCGSLPRIRTPPPTPNSPCLLQGRFLERAPPFVAYSSQTCADRNPPISTLTRPRKLRHCVTAARPQELQLPGSGAAKCAECAECESGTRSICYTQTHR